MKQFQHYFSLLSHFKTRCISSVEFIHTVCGLDLAVVVTTTLFVGTLYVTVMKKKGVALNRHGTYPKTDAVF